jgi:hypothetical protein
MASNSPGTKGRSVLTVFEPTRGINRRGFLTLGTLGLGGLSLSSLMAGEERLSSHISGKSVIFLFQQGGPSQFETFDPKPEAPLGTRTVTDTVRTTIPGVNFGEPMSQLAKLAHKLTIVRSFQTNNGEHNIVPIVSPHTLNANIGSLYSHVAGSVRAESGMPTNVVVFPQSVCTDVTKGGARGNIAATGILGPAHAPFIPGNGGQLQKNLRLNVPRERLEDRRLLLSKFNGLVEKNDRTQQDIYRDQAYQVLLSGRVADAFDLSKEDAKTVVRYDTSQFVKDHNWSTAARGKRGYYTGQAKSIGKLLLLARRLCEAGCGFVTIHADYEGIWDMHADVENLNIKDGMEAVGRPFDHAVAAFIEDVEARGLSEKIMLVCCGEMGRTPRINRTGGRDHWGKLAPLLFYGAGTSGGRVIGQSTRDGGEPATENYTPANLISTILHTVFDVSQLRLMPRLAAVSRLAEAEPIPLMS